MEIEAGARLAGQGPGQQGLAAAGRPVEQDALGTAAPRSAKRPGSARNSLISRSSSDGRVLAGHVGEGHQRVLGGDPAGPAAEPEQAGAPAVGDDQVGEQQGDDQPRQQKAAKAATRFPTCWSTVMGALASRRRARISRWLSRISGVLYVPVVPSRRT